MTYALSGCKEDWADYESRKASYPAAKASWDAQMAQYNSAVLAYEQEKQAYLARLASLRDANASCSKEQTAYQDQRAAFEAAQGVYNKSVADRNKQATAVSIQNSAGRSAYATKLALYKDALTKYEEDVRAWAVYDSQVAALKAANLAAWEKAAKAEPWILKQSFPAYLNCGGTLISCWPSNRSTSKCKSVNGLGWSPQNSSPVVDDCSYWQLALRQKLVCPSCPPSPSRPRPTVRPTAPALWVDIQLPAEIPPFTGTSPSVPLCVVKSETTAGSAPVPPVVPSGGPAEPVAPQCSVPALISPPTVTDPSAYMPPSESKGASNMGLWLLLAAGAVGAYVYVKRK